MSVWQYLLSPLQIVPENVCLIFTDTAEYCNVVCAEDSPSCSGIGSLVLEIIRIHNLAHKTPQPAGILARNVLTPCTVTLSKPKARTLSFTATENNTEARIAQLV